MTITREDIFRILAQEISATIESDDGRHREHIGADRFTLWKATDRILDLIESTQAAAGGW